MTETANRESPPEQNDACRGRRPGELPRRLVEVFTWISEREHLEKAFKVYDARGEAGGWEELDPLRERSLARLRKEDERHVRHVGKLFMAVVYDGIVRARKGAWTPPAELRALLKDLRHVEGGCKALQSWIEDVECPQREAEAVELVDAVGLVLAVMGDLLEEALGQLSRKKRSAAQEREPRP